MRFAHPWVRPMASSSVMVFMWGPFGCVFRVRVPGPEPCLAAVGVFAFEYAQGGDVVLVPISAGLTVSDGGVGVYADHLTALPRIDLKDSLRVVELGLYSLGTAPRRRARIRYPLGGSG